MKNFYPFLHTLLSIPPLLGGIGLLSVFLLCFFMVHVAMLTKRGWQVSTKPTTKTATPTTTQKPIEPEKKAPATATPAQEPIYYIVERKQTRKKSRYGEPKEFRFKE